MGFFGSHQFNDTPLPYPLLMHPPNNYIDQDFQLLNTEGYTAEKKAWWRPEYTDFKTDPFSRQKRENPQSQLAT